MERCECEEIEELQSKVNYLINENVNLHRLISDMKVYSEKQIDILSNQIQIIMQAVLL